METRIALGGRVSSGIMPVSSPSQMKTRLDPFTGLYGAVVKGGRDIPVVRKTPYIGASRLTRGLVLENRRIQA